MIIAFVRIHSTRVIIRRILQTVIINTQTRRFVIRQNDGGLMSGIR